MKESSSTSVGCFGCALSLFGLMFIVWLFTDSGFSKLLNWFNHIFGG